MAKPKRIEDETPIMPDIVAESVVEHVNVCHGLRLGRAQVAALILRQKFLYSRSPEWRKKMKAGGNKGRDTLYAFMYHWLASDLRKKNGKVAESVADFATWGTPMKCRRRTK